LFPESTDLLGEIQFTFVVFMLGQNLEALEQWKALLCLVSTCREAIASGDSLYFKLIPVIYSQLEELPIDFFVSDELAYKGNNFIQFSVTELILNSKSAPTNVKARVEKLK
jgi:A1 cistron-splicing factor AAR2